MLCAAVSRNLSALNKALALQAADRIAGGRARNTELAGDVTDAHRPASG